MAGKNRTGIHPVSIAQSRDGEKQSLNFRPPFIKEMDAQGVLGFIIKPVKSSAAAFTMKPVFRLKEGERPEGYYKLQRKRSGHGHMEFPLWLTGKSLGLIGKSSKAEVYLFAKGAVQVRRPAQAAVSKAVAKKAKR